MYRLFWLLPFFGSVLFGDMVEDGLKNIPLHHRVCIRAFFEHAITHDFDVFRSILGKEFTQPRFLAQLEQGSALPELLNRDEMLLDIILGFGKESSLLIHDYFKIKIGYVQCNWCTFYS